MVQLVQEDGCVKLAIVPGPRVLYCLVDCLLVPVMKQIGDLSGPVHSFDSDLDRLRFVCRDHVIHSPHITAGLDLDCIPRLNLHRCDVIGGRTDFVRVDCSN
jgi:hypothetical protein